MSKTEQRLQINNGYGNVADQQIPDWIRRGGHYAHTHTTTKRSNRPKADAKTRDIMHRAKGGIIFSECKEIIFLGIGFSKVNSKKAKKKLFFLF